VVRYCYANFGHLGPGSSLILGGKMTPEGFEQTQSMLTRVEGGCLDRRLNANIANGQGQASELLFELIKKRWKLAYVKVFDSGTVIYLGTRRLGKVEDDAKLLEQVMTLGQVPTVASALAKLRRLFPADARPRAVTVSC
jgi:hypothetical protein